MTVQDPLPPPVYTGKGPLSPLLIDEDDDICPISPWVEMGAYEALWLDPKASFKRMAERFAAYETALPSNFVDPDIALDAACEAAGLLADFGVNHFGIRINHTGNYPVRFRDARHPLELFYFQGEWELADSRSVAIVGSRNASLIGRKRASKIARELVQNNITVVSGLAKGIDTAALQSAIKYGGRVIGVIGTPLGVYYPTFNRDLQDEIAADHLLLSQVPVLKHSRQKINGNKLFFPERNATMSALTLATVIVEAGNTSGALIQAREALYQDRKLFIMDSCFYNDNISWPEKFLKKGAVRIRSTDDILEHLD